MSAYRIATVNVANLLARAVRLKCAAFEMAVAGA